MRAPMPILSSANHLRPVPSELRDSKRAISSFSWLISRLSDLMLNCRTCSSPFCFALVRLVTLFRTEASHGLPQVHDDSAGSWNHLHHSLANGLSIRGEELIDEQIKIPLLDEAQFQKWQSCDKIRLGRLVVRETRADRSTQSTSFLEHIGHEATIDDQSVDSSATSQVNQPA